MKTENTNLDKNWVHLGCGKQPFSPQTVLFDILPKPFRTFELQRRALAWLRNVRDGKVKIEDIPEDLLTGLYDAIGPAANIGKQVGRATGLIEDKRKKAANQ